jgi:hypothetical protein
MSGLYPVILKDKQESNFHCIELFYFKYAIARVLSQKLASVNSTTHVLAHLPRYPWSR